MKQEPKDPALRRLLASIPNEPPGHHAAPGLSVQSALIGQLVGQVNGPMVITTGELTAGALEALLKQYGAR